MRYTDEYVDDDKKKAINLNVWTSATIYVANRIVTDSVCGVRELCAKIGQRRLRVSMLEVRQAVARKPNRGNSRLPCFGWGVRGIGGTSV